MWIGHLFLRETLLGGLGVTRPPDPSRGKEDLTIASVILANLSLWDEFLLFLFFFIQIPKK